MPSDRIRLISPEKVLETRRLLLEPLTAAHAAILYEPLLNSRLYTFIPQDPPASERALEDRYRKLSTRRSPDGSEAWLNWAARERETGRYAGTLEATVQEDGAAFVAYMVFVACQRRGFAAEGCGRLLAHLFDDYGVSVVVAEIDTRNAASVALVESLGFRRVALRRDADHFKGASSDEYRYELGRPEHRRC
ncbi:GNAT family N-acetyltransferase [Rubrobacter tropicus]|uniref:GNAT family N-acetyltransferase n=1 Tax=Rubrobacter tropicus TaxID=2653851 RepID=A0A6G8Q7H4_9ACTN|nr:GNAT family protein [Rubrobacter tropicus]QIN82431.1 GNAT family N-acetyltransferase [Rubrobacter tropicus]